ncbi:MAG TPA: FHA domain-containing protein [Ktedonobacteraceae bacterium]|nr:FHA domain-containing protein [Ktedonobacteraceae bacterium]
MGFGDFPTWFSYGCYGGLACCIFAMTVNSLYTTLRRRGTTRQLAGVIVTCAISALLLLPAILWYNVRFTAAQMTLADAEIEVALAYVALWGWLLPLSITVAYCLFTQPRTTTASMAIAVPHQRRTTRLNEATVQRIPHSLPGIPAPFVYSEETPWGWLEHRGGNFKGQRLALKRAIVTIGRGEDNEIWLDDDLASRHHAELAWDNGTVYLTDRDSMNGVLLNGKRIRGSACIEPGELLEIGSHRFLFEKAQQPEANGEQDDPLLRHVWHSANSNVYAATRPLEDDERNNPAFSQVDATLNPDMQLSQPLQSLQSLQPPQSMPGETPPALFQDTAELDQVTPHPQPTETTGAFIIRNGPLAGQSFLLDRPVISIGRGIECDIVINDISISRCHAQVLRQTNGNFVQDLASRNGTSVNDKPLLAPHPLEPGDIVCFGNVQLEYTPIQTARTTPLPMIITPQPSPRLLSGPVPLRLPSKPR